jgi:hypothetical protein
MIEQKIRIQELRDTVDAIDHLQEAGLNDKAKDVLIKMAEKIMESLK